MFICVGEKRKKRKKGEWGLTKGNKYGAVDSEHGASKSERSQLHTKEPPFQVRGLSSHT
jgi:hypothetical protein